MGDEEPRAGSYSALLGLKLTRGLELLALRAAGIASNRLSELIASMEPLKLRLLEPGFGVLSGEFARVLSVNLDGQLRRLKEVWHANWPEDDPAWAAASEIMNDGIPLIWVPREEIVVALTNAADGDARRDLLVRRRADIVADCLAVLGEVLAPELLPLAGLAGDAGRALADGHHAAAQALAANVFDTWLRDAARRGAVVSLPGSGWFAYKKVSGQLKPMAGDVTIRELRAAGAHAPALMALAQFEPGDPVPAEFGRHATAHAAGPEQYSDANAVIAVMLAASVLRQSQASGW